MGIAEGWRAFKSWFLQELDLIPYRLKTFLLFLIYILIVVIFPELGLYEASLKVKWILILGMGLPVSVMLLADLLTEGKTEIEKATVKNNANYLRWFVHEKQLFSEAGKLIKLALAHRSYGKIIPTLHALMQGGVRLVNPEELNDFLWSVNDRAERESYNEKEKKFHAEILRVIADYHGSDFTQRLKDHVDSDYPALSKMSLIK